MISPMLSLALHLPNGLTSLSSHQVSMVLLLLRRARESEKKYTCLWGEVRRIFQIVTHTLKHVTFQFSQFIRKAAARRARMRGSLTRE